MKITFLIRLKWIRFKFWLSDLFSIQHERRFIDRDAGKLGGVLLIAAVLLTSCGSFQIGVEPTGTPVVDSTPPAPTTVEPEATPAEMQTQTAHADRPGPDIYWMPYGSGLFESDDVIMAEDGVVGFSESPVTFELFYDYSPSSGRIAYGSEFWHAAANSNRAVSDLWVYDFTSEQAHQLLADNVGRALFSPRLASGRSSDRLAAVVFSPDRGVFDLALVESDGSLDVLAECASPGFSWSPDGSMIAYEAWTDPEEEPTRGECEGVFVVSIDDRSVTKLSEQPPSTGGWHGDQPIWAEGQDALLLTYASPESVFAVVPLDGSGAFLVDKAESIPVDYLPNPMFSLWSEEHNSVIGQTEGMFDPFGVWVYQFSQDMRTVQDAYRITVDGRELDLQLIGWWEEAESVLLRDITNLSELNQFGRAIAWSLEDRSWQPVPDNTAPIEVRLHKDDVRSGVVAVDQAIEAFVDGDRGDRLALLEMISAECVAEQFGVGPPLCPAGTPAGTELVVFPYRVYRGTEFAAEGELAALVDFEINGLYAVHPISGEFEDAWWPAGDYRIVFASPDDDHAVEVIVDQDGRIVRIEFREQTPVEVLYGYSGDFIIPPVD